MAKHDPEGRRKAIVDAAAAVLIDERHLELTHRRVAERAGVPLGATTYYFRSLADLEEAALAVLAEKLESEISEITRMLDTAAERPPAVITRLAEGLHAYLGDREQVRADCALYVAATRRASLRPLALRWFDGFTAVLAKHTDERTALAIAIFADGAGVHAMLHDEPVDADFLADVITRLTTGSRT